MIPASIRPCVERLESRCLMSVAPAAHHPAPPNIVNFDYTGTYATTSGQTGTISLDITSESKSGKIAGILALSVLGTPFTMKFSGSVNPKWDINFHGSSGHKSLNAKGVINSDLTAQSGTFVFHSKHANTHGTYNGTTA